MPMVVVVVGPRTGWGLPGRAVGALGPHLWAVVVCTAEAHPGPDRDIADAVGVWPASCARYRLSRSRPGKDDSRFGDVRGLLESAQLTGSFINNATAGGSGRQASSSGREQTRRSAIPA